MTTLEYRINTQQILFKFWVLDRLHAYFVINNNTEKNVAHNLFFNHLFTTYTLIWSARLFGALEYAANTSKIDKSIFVSKIKTSALGITYVPTLTSKFPCENMYMLQYYSLSRLGKSWRP